MTIQTVVDALTSRVQKKEGFMKRYREPTEFCSPLVAVIAAASLGGCETAAPWMEPLELGRQQASEEETSEYEHTAASSEDGERTTVVCTATGMERFAPHAAALPYTTEILNIANGTFPVCPPSPCEIEPRLGLKNNEVIVNVAINPAYDFAVLDDPILTVTGVSKHATISSATVEMSTQAFGPLPPIYLSAVGYNVAITVDASDFVQISGATVSWIPRSQPLDDIAPRHSETVLTKSTHAELSSGAASINAVQETGGVPAEQAMPQQSYAICCDACCHVENGMTKCICLRSVPYGSECP